ncbi:MAG: insulinase family protein [Oscillospiraceae bacterium]|jgi:predicted Zn-dependent peptidase|nr:insulinase family protein [Oscillospiraceae bacterium]
MSEVTWEAIHDAALEETYHRCKHPSGLEIQVCAKPGYSSAYALFSTKYGSIDTAIAHDDGTVTRIPEGTAHFLEHKLFESEDLDAFARFAKVGASANAFTSFYKTAYEFSCSGRFDENLEILLDFVQSPYFTEATVRKEQGIIGQEIRMYLDNPGWAEMMNLLQILYAAHPVRCDIAGTEQSIATITAELLHECYRNFYNLHNMALTVAGNVTKEQVLAVADRMLKTGGGGRAAVRPRMADNGKPAQTEIRRKMAVSVPTFLLGCKEEVDKPLLTAEECIAADLVLDTLLGEASPLYEQLLEEGLVNAGFGSDLFDAEDYACSLMGGESRQPDLAAEKIKGALLRAAEKGLDPEDFERARRKAYGRLLMDLNDVDALANSLCNAWLVGDDMYARARALREVTLEQANGRMRRMFRPGYFALSVIEPIGEGKA